jgi:conjugal transfer pilus assembly protein TraB
VQPDTNQSPQNQSNDGRTGNLFAVVESASTTQEVEESPIYVPKGSILTGVLLTGLDAPTAASASDTPIPVLVRLKKEAILPNFAVVEEVRECFAILAGYGDLSSERVFLRGESITCVREDGGIIEANFKSFAVGEDGKNGLKGTLVSRNSTMLANAMMAGFASGMAAMFDVNPVPVITTSSDGTQQYQDVFSTDAVQGGAAKGASQSMGKLADYYMKLADSIHPVIEIGAGRVVDMVITEGAKL